MNDYAKEILHTIAKALRRPNGRKLRRREKIMERRIKKALKGQKEKILEATRKFLNKKSIKSINEDIDDFFENLDDRDMIDGILSESGQTMLFGANFRIKKHNLAKLGIQFDLSHPLAEEFLKTDRVLILSKLKDTTKDHIKPILLNAVETGASYEATAALITKNYALSPVRSLMIAVHETGVAYEYGNYVPLKDAEDQGKKVVKQWSTVGDDRVTETHQKNEDDGWIGLDDEFSGTGDLTAPGSDNPRCRCTTLYEIRS